MKTNQDIEIFLTPQEIAKMINDEWCDEDVIKFLNELGKYQDGIKDLLIAVSDCLQDEYQYIELDKNGKLALLLIKKFINKGEA